MLQYSDILLFQEEGYAAFIACRDNEGLSNYIHNLSLMILLAIQHIKVTLPYQGSLLLEQMYTFCHLHQADG